MTPAPSASGRHVIRAPNHLGDVVMALPAMAADGADIVVRRWLAPLIEMAGLPARVLPFDRGFAGWRAAVGMLRREPFERGTLLTPSFSAAWLFRWGGVGTLRGTATDARSWLLADRIPVSVLRNRHRINQYKLILNQDPESPAVNHPLTPPAGQVVGWRERVGGDGPVVGLFPGSNAPARRWPVERFAEVARTLSARGVRTVVMGGENERALTRTVASGVSGAVQGGVSGAVDAGGATDLPGLAALLSVCDLVVTNDTGPMHLAGAVGTPTVTLWGSSDPAEVRPVGAHDVQVTGADLPCKPCFKNHCPRSGAGTLLPDAEEECMKLISVAQVIETVEALLDGHRPGPAGEASP